VLTVSDEIASCKPRASAKNHPNSNNKFLHLNCGPLQRKKKKTKPKRIAKSNC